jgi:hypothetical protein
VTLSLRFVQSIKKIDIHGSYSIQYYREGGAGRLHPCPSCQPLPQSKSGPRTEEPTADPKSTASAAHPSHPSPSIKEKTKRTNVRSHSPLDRCCPSDHSIHFPSLCDTQMRQVLFVRALSQLMGPRLRAKYHSAHFILCMCATEHPGFPARCGGCDDTQAGRVASQMPAAYIATQPKASLESGKNKQQSSSEGCLKATIKKTML